jgi:tRNA1(Val) A37 N6-methylase TrmN6
MAENREIINDLLGYDGLKIIQRTDMFHFSLDSTLLADFVHIPATAGTIMDFGTGNAPIPLFLSLKTDRRIIGVEIQPEVFDLARRSVELNHLESRIELIQADIKDLHRMFSPESIDIITCNPPFFRYCPEGHLNKNEYLTIARHEVLIDLEGILTQARRLLSRKGRLFLIHRADRLEDVVRGLQKADMAMKRLRFIYPKKGKDAIAMLLEARVHGQSGSLKLMEPLYVYEESGEYTPEIRNIFRYGKKDS